MENNVPKDKQPIRMLEVFLSPRSIAVIGASRAEDKVRHAVLGNMIKNDFKGYIFPINPGEEQNSKKESVIT